MDNAEDALPDVTDGGDILAVRSAADLTPQAVAEATPSQLVTLVEPLLNLLNQTSRQLAPLLEKGGAELEKFVTPVGATLQEWSLTLQPLVERGGDEVNKVLAPVREQLEQLQARLEPYTTPAIDAARSAVTNVVDVIKGLLHQLAPLWQEACRGTLEWHATQLTPFLATTGEQIKLISVAALDTSAAAIEDVKLRSVAAAQVGAPHHCCHTLQPHLPLPHPPSHHGYHTILTRLRRARRSSAGHAAVERDHPAAVGGADGPANSGAHGQLRGPRARVEREPAAALVERDERGAVRGGDRVVDGGAPLLLPAHRERRRHGGAQGARGQAAGPRAPRERARGTGRLPGRSRADRRRLEGAAQAPSRCYIVSCIAHGLACTLVGGGAAPWAKGALEDLVASPTFRMCQCVCSCVCVEEVRGAGINYELGACRKSAISMVSSQGILSPPGSHVPILGLGVGVRRHR